MNSEWKTYHLREAGKILTGKTPKGGVSEFTGDDVSFITPSDFSGEKWINQSIRSISELGAQSVKGSIIPPRAVLITCIGSDMGKVAITASRCVTNQQINAIVVDESKFSPEFLYYNLRLRKEEIRNLAGGSAQPILNKSSFGQIYFAAPALNEQSQIVDVLKPFDDCITLLRETNKTLESIAQTIFKSWFVDFDPVRAKMEGRQPEGMDEETAALFPNEFEESELGLIPKGWGIVRLEELMTLSYGKALRAAERISGEVPVYGSGGITGYHNQSIVEGPSIIIGRKGTVGSLYWEDSPFFPIDTVFYVKTALPLTFCFYLLQIMKLSDMNTDAAVPGLNRNNVYRLKVALPTSLILNSFDDIVTIIRQKILKNNEAAKSLESMRDLLLPRLISGQLRLSDRAEAEELAAM